MCIGHPNLNDNTVPKPKIRYPFAKTGDSKFIFIEDAKKKTKYTCWGCSTQMFKRGGPHRTDHFYHKGESCSLETAIHEGFKNRLYQIIANGLKKNKESSKDKVKLYIRWHCIKCNAGHKGNLLGPITDAKLEKKVDRFRPDISLYRSDQSVYAAIEIEYSHSLEEKPREYYNRNDIGIIIFVPTTLDDIKSLESDSIIPHSCNLCRYSANDTEGKENITAESSVVETRDTAADSLDKIPINIAAPEWEKERITRFSLIFVYLSNLFTRIVSIFKKRKNQDTEFRE